MPQKDTTQKSPTVLEMVQHYLETNGYDGLFNADYTCACVPDDLVPCGELCGDCCAGYKHPCVCGEGCDSDIGSREEADKAIKGVQND